MADTTLPKRPSLSPCPCYIDPRAAFDWLQAAFGFELEMLLEDADGNIAHAELRYGDGVVMVGSKWTDTHRSPADIDGANTQTIHMHLEEDIDAHCERARAAGATIFAEPENQFYGDRTYRARDPEGHIWTFSQTVENLTPDQWDAASGLRTTLGPKAGGEA
ncbi:MAG: VOC family protein [Hyphomonadaceae bacterium]